MTVDNPDFDHLDRAARLGVSLSLRPRTVAYAAMTAAVLVSWLVLLLMAGTAGRAALAGEAGPGGWMLALLPAVPVPEALGRFFVLCATPATLDADVPGLLILWLTWALMAVAMMLPSAAPMIRTYCEIADTAAGKGQRAVHPLVLISGYLTMWLAAALLFSLPSLLLTTSPATPLVASAALALAGLYQFSALKEACLRKCGNPFAILFARWSDRTRTIFRLGMAQGLWCLGCCWALMLVMFAVGVMNVFWMALIGLFSIVEKQSHGRIPGRIAGAMLLVWAAALLAVSR